jgi:hypothetical protein
MNIKRPPPREAQSKERTPLEGQTHQNKPWQALHTAGSGTTADPQTLPPGNLASRVTLIRFEVKNLVLSSEKTLLHAKRPLPPPSDRACRW